MFMNLKLILFFCYCVSSPVLAMKKIVENVSSLVIGNIFDEIKKGNLKKVKAILKKGVSVNCLNKKGQTPLFVAIDCNNTPITQALIEKNADVNFKNSEGYTPLHVACRKRAPIPEIIQYLIEAHADVNARNNIEGTPLHCAVTPSSWSESVLEAQLKAISILIDNGAYINCPDKYGRTPLHIAAGNASQEEYKRVVQKLLDYGADPYRTDKYGKYPFQCAKLAQTRRIILVQAMRAKKAKKLEESSNFATHFATRLTSLMKKNVDTFSCAALVAMQRM